MCLVFRWILNFAVNSESSFLFASEANKRGLILSRNVQQIFQKKKNIDIYQVMFVFCGSTCNCNDISFTKLPWPGPSEGAFIQPLTQTATCSPAYTINSGRFILFLFFLW